MAGFAEIARETLLQVFGFTDVKEPSFGIEHAIHAGTATARGQECTWIKRLGHFQALASTMP
jgi:hypothetical protein